MNMNRPRTNQNDSLVQRADADQNAIEESMRNVTLADSRSLRVFEAGNGEPLLCFPMVRELNFVYAPQIEALQDIRRVIVYEPRLSQTKHVGIKDRAEEASLLLDALGIEAAHIVAWSDAGSAAYVFAKLWPKRCLSAVFLGLADNYRFPQPMQLLVALLKNLPIEGLVPAALLARILSKYLSGRQVNPSWIARRVRRSPGFPRLFKHSVLPNLTEHQPKRGEVRAPSVVICGDDDALVSVDQARRMAALLSGKQDAVIIPGGEHFLGYVNATATNRAIRDFYQRISATTP